MNNYIAISVKNPEKGKCGDEYVLLMVTDRVSSAPKDWLASRSAVDIILKELAQSSLPAHETFKVAVETANQTICTGVENTYGMLTTLSALLYSQKTDKLWLVNIGDSRIYGVKSDKWKLLSIDDSKCINYKENDQLKFRNGMPVMMHALTKAIGQPGIEVAVTEISADEYEAIILVSDGFYGLSDFEGYAERLIRETDMIQTAKEIQKAILSEITDDASLAMFCLPANVSIDLKTVISQGAATKVSAIDVLNVLEAELINAMIEKDIRYTDNILNFMQEKEISYSIEKMITLLDLMIANQSPAVYKMTSIIRKLKKL